MSVHRTSKKCKISYLVLLIICFILIFVFVFFRQLSEHIDEISEYTGRNAAVELINEAVGEQLESFSVEECLKTERNQDGEIISVSTDTPSVNKINNSISKAVTDNISNIENEEINVPVGTLSGITFLTGRGFDVPLKLHQIGAVSTKMNSELVCAGINQTKYRVYIEISVEMSAVLPAYSTDISVNYQYLVGEKVIVGEVPQMYLEK